jgi:hypothetical protein
MLDPRLRGDFGIAHRYQIRSGYGAFSHSPLAAQ